MKTKLSDAQKIKQVADDNDWGFRPRYSGRWMFGSQCPGIVCGASEVHAVVSAVKRRRIKCVPSWDNMGLDMIVYWPSIVSDPATYEGKDE